MAIPSRKNIFLIGESPLIEEFGEICSTAFSVHCKETSTQKRRALPRSLRKTNTVPRNLALAVELTNTDPTAKRNNLLYLDKLLLGSTTILSSSVTVTTTEQASWLRHPERLVGIGAIPGILRNRLMEIAPSVHSDNIHVTRATEFARQLDKEFAIIQDRAGMVLPRILCMLINEAAFALTEGTASPADIDTAMKLGTNYPFGPVEWGDRMGFKHVVSVLEAIHEETAEERYRIAPLLRQLATGAKWW